MRTYICIVYILVCMGMLPLTISCKKQPPPVVLSPDTKTLVRSYNRTGYELYKKLSTNTGNIVFSPYSICTALSMVRAGAQGQTEAEIAQAVHLTLSQDKTNQANYQLYTALNRFSTEDIVLNTANALCLTQNGHVVDPQYTNLLSQSYQANLFTAKTVEPINNYISEKTDSKITSLLKDLSPDSVCVLLNALYFKGLWEVQFDKAHTTKHDFHVSENTTVSVPLMMNTDEFRYAEHDMFTTLSMTYRTGAVAMISLLPGENQSLEQLVKSLSWEDLQQTIGTVLSVPKREVRVGFPRVTLESGLDLTGVLKSMGIQKGFTAEADFSGMTGPGTENIWINQVLHNVYIEVNEEGTEAAAATVVEMEKTAAPQPLSFIADHPFLFMVYDVTSECILLMGQLVNPKNE